MPNFVSLCFVKIELDSLDLEQQEEEGASVDAVKLHCSQRTLKDRERDRGLRASGNITIESYINIENMDQTKNRGILPYSSSRETTPLDENQMPTEFPKEIACFSGNPFVEVTKGVIHLYKKNDRKDISEGPSAQLCLLAVPASLSCHDLLKFVAPCHEVIQHIRIIRDNNPNQFMVLLEFRSNESALEFYQTYNGAPYNSLEPDSLCHAVWVSHIEWGTDGMTPTGHTELPTCPVCLERMDESVDGVLTILCNHVFHANCLIKWGDLTCPVCRHVQTPELMENSVCMECEGTEALWICLICGHIGCCRYQGGHAASHYRATQHTYAMQLGTSSVWDYAGDNFVHRLYQNKTDGKLVATQSADGGEEENKEKIDSMQLEFTYLLTSQLETQRKYYEEKISLLENDWSKYKTKTDSALNKYTDMQTDFQLLSKEKNLLEKKLASNTMKLKEIQKQLVEECEMSKALQENQSSWHTKYLSVEKRYKEYQERKDAELADVKDQLRDIMFYMEAQSKISESDIKEELTEGKVFVPENTTNGAKPKNRRNKKR